MTEIFSTEFTRARGSVCVDKRAASKGLFSAIKTPRNRISDDRTGHDGHDQSGQLTAKSRRGLYSYASTTLDCTPVTILGPLQPT